MKFIAIGLFCAVSLVGTAQKLPDYDSLPTRMLSEVIILAPVEVDSFQHFYRTNRAATTEDILNRLQGVNLIRRGSYGLEPVLRGMTAGQISLTIDGMKMFGACTDKMDPVSIYVEPRNLQAINIYTGIFGSRYGSTVGGAIDMKLNQPQFSKQGFSGQVGTGYQGVSEAINHFAAANYAAGRGAYNINVNYRKAGNYVTGDRIRVPYTQFEKLNVSAGARFQVGQDTVSGNVVIDDGWNIGYAALPMDVGHAKARIYSLTFQRYRCHGFVESLVVKGYFNNVLHTMDDTQRPDIAMHMDMPGRSATYGLFAEGKVHAMGKHRLFFRGDVYRNDVLAEMVMYPPGETPMYMQTWPASSRTEGGIYLEDAITLRQGLKMKADLRLDLSRTRLDPEVGVGQLMVFYPDLSNSYMSLRKAFGYSVQKMIGPRFAIDAHAGYGERLATLSEMFGYYLFNRSDGYDYLGNIDLKTEKAWSGDIGLNFFGAGVQSGLSVYYKYLSDYIMGIRQGDIRAMTPGADGVKLYSNISSATFAGMDANVLAKITGSIKFVQVVKFTYAKDNAGVPLPMIPPLTGISTIQYSRSHWSLQGEWEAAWRQNRINTDFGEDRTPSYGIVNLRGQYALWRGMVVVNGGIENILDKTYHAHLDWGNVPRPGRNIFLSLTVGLTR